MAKVRQYVSGIGASIEGVQKTGRLSKEALVQGIRDAAQVAYDRSQVYVPVEFGNLRASGRIFEGGEMEFAILYGGKEADYALPVHEIPGAYHAPPTCWKYLERAVRETRNQQSYAVKRRMKSQVTGVLTKKGRKKGQTFDIAEFGE